MKFKKSYFNKKNNSGFTIIEAMIAIGLILVGIMGTITLINRSLGFTSNVFNKLTASYLGQEGVEIIRNLRDTNWLNQQDWAAGLADGDYQADYSTKTLQIFADLPLLYDETTGLYGYGAGTETIYTRKIQIKHFGENEIRVQVTVSWIGKGGAIFNTVIEDHLFNWL